MESSDGSYLGSIRAVFTSEDRPNELDPTSAKEIKNECSTRFATINDPIHNHEFNQNLYQDEDTHESVIAIESSTETLLQPFTTESDIDNTAELLPSGGIQSHYHGGRTAVSETSPPQLTSTGLKPKTSDDLIANQPSSSLLRYSQGNFNQLSRTESTKKLELPEGILEKGKTEPQDNVTVDLYGDGTYRAHLETADSFRNVEQCVSIRRRSDDNNDEDRYTDSNPYEAKHMSFGLDQRNKLSRAKFELMDNELFKIKVWHIPNPAKKDIKVDGMKLKSGNDYQSGSTEKEDHADRGYRESDEETLMIKSTEYGSQTNGPLGKHATTSQKFLYVPKLPESYLTDDIELKSTMQMLQENKTIDDAHNTVKHNACYADHSQKMADSVCKDVEQYEGEAANGERQKDEVYIKTVNYENDQGLETKSSAITLVDENISQATCLSLEGITNTNKDNSLQLSDGERQLSTQLNIPIHASQEDKPLSWRDAEDQPQICTHNAVTNRVENRRRNRRGIKKTNCKARKKRLKPNKNTDLSTMYPKRVATRRSTPVLKGLSSSQPHEINDISPDHDLIFTGYGTDNGGTTMESSIRSLKIDCSDAGIKTLVGEHHGEHEPSKGYHVPYFEAINQQDHVTSINMNINKHSSRDDNKEMLCHSIDQNSETANQKESPKTKDASGSVQQTNSKRDNNTITSSKIISNDNLQINNLQIPNRSSDLSINSSKMTEKPSCTLIDTIFNPSYSVKAVSPGDSFQCTSTISDCSQQNLATLPDMSHGCTTSSLDSFYQYKTASLDLHDQCQTSDNSPNQCTAIILDSSSHCTVSPVDPSNQCKTTVQESSFQSGVTFLDQSDQLTTISHNSTNQGANNLCNSSAFFSKTSLDPSECKITSSSRPTCENIATSHGSSNQCSVDFPTGIYRFTNASPNLHDQCTDNSADPSNQYITCMTNSSHQCLTTSEVSQHCISYPYDHTVSNYNTHNSCTTNSPNSSPQSSTSSPDLPTSTINPDLPDNSTANFDDPDLSCSSISLIASSQHATTSTESSNQCTHISVDSQLSLPCENNLDCRPLKEPIQDEYGCLIKQHEFSFLGEVRRIYLDNQNVGFSLLDSGIVLTKRTEHLGKLALMRLRNGEELGTVIQSSKLFLNYQLEKHFYVKRQLNEDWYYIKDRITKVNMLMKKVPLTSNWLKTLRNFLCLPSDCRLLIPYAVITDRNGSVLFLMENRDVLGVGMPPLRYVLSTMKNLSTVLRFMRYCRIHRVLPRKITTSILYTPQGICFDPSSLCNNDDLCEFNKCLKECLLLFLFNGQQDEFGGAVELLLERAQLLLEENWPLQICLARLLSLPTPGALPFNLHSTVT